MITLRHSNWIDLINTYKELRVLWDTKHRAHSNKKLRLEAYEKLFEKYKTIDRNASLLNFLQYFKKKFDNMRTTYGRERKKVDLYRRNGRTYRPTLWYFKHLRFLDGTIDVAHKRTTDKYFNRYNDKLYLENTPARKRKSILNGSNTPKPAIAVKVKSGFIQVGPEQSSEEEEEEDNTENIQPPAEAEDPSKPKPIDRLCDLMEKQDKFMTVVTKMLSKKDEDWEVVGRAIGHRLCSLGPKQRLVAYKLINDVIYHGKKDSLTVESFVRVERPDSPFKLEEEHVYYVDDEYLDKIDSK